MTKKLLLNKTFALNEVEKVVKSDLLPLFSTYKIFAFKGPLGAGKTTMIKELFRQSGVKDTVTSPTFMYVKKYETDNEKYNKKFYHFDLYRLDTVDDFFGLGFDEYLLEENSISVIEWPGVIKSLLGDKTCWVELDYLDDDLERRSIKISVL